MVKSYASFGHLKHSLFVSRVGAIGCHICRQRGLISVCTAGEGRCSTGSIITDVPGIRDGGSVPDPGADALVEGCCMFEHFKLTAADG